VVQPARFPWASALIVLGGLLLGLAGGLIVFYGAPVALRPSATQSAAVGREPPAGTAVGPSAPAPVVGAPAPDFSLKDLSNTEVSLSSYKGQIVLLNFWATWCGPCKLEMPTLQQHYVDYQAQGLVVVGVEAGDPAADVQAFATEQKLTFPILTDEKSTVTDMYRVIALPTTFLIDRQGMIVRQQRGMMSEAQLDGYLAELDFKKP
jgi:cytochrome c biogenesis protein CcmG, thiol:disulfide interchange protein DsbE